MSEFFTLKEAASKARCSVSLLQKRCRDGTIPAYRVGKDYRVHWGDVEAWLKRSSQRAIERSDAGKPFSDDLLALIDAWDSHCKYVRAFSPTTSELYGMSLRVYIRRASQLGANTANPGELLAPDVVSSVFAKVPPRSYSAKMNTYLVLRSFAKFLIGRGVLESKFLSNLEPLKPRRQAEPRRTHLKSRDIPRLFETIFTRRRPATENNQFAAMIACMVYGGLRVSEVCRLRIGDVDLIEGTIVVRHGKGGKDRRIGIGRSLSPYLVPFSRSPGISERRFFLQANGEPWNKDLIGRRMRGISRRMGVDITCHGLRRTFATLAAENGRPVNNLRIALGHTNLTTTQSYLRTSEAEVVEQMRDW